MSKLYGVNLAGGEFGGGLPGTLHQDYEYPHEEQFSYYSSKGLHLVRVPFKQERVMRGVRGVKIDAYLLSTGLFPMLDLAQRHGVQVLLEPHSFGRWYGIPYTRLADDRDTIKGFVSEFVNATCEHPAVWGYEFIGNEPHDLAGDPNTTWMLDLDAANAARALTSKTLVWATPKWQSARYLADYAAGFAWSGDANSCLGVHVYGDGDSSGSYSKPYAQDIDLQVTPNALVKPTTMADRLQYAINWATTKKVNLLVTECGVPVQPEWLTMLDTMLGTVDRNANVLGAFLWAGGPWWGDYPLSTEPTNGQDKPQITTLLKHT